MKPLTQIILDTRRAKLGNTYPLKLRVTFNRKQKYFLTDINLTKEDYEKTTTERPRGDFKDLQIKIAGIEDKAVKIIDSISHFSFEKFENQFYNKPKTKKTTLNDYYKEYIYSLKSEERIKTAQNYQDSLNSLIAFCPKVNFDSITPDFLSKYERWMLENKKSVSTVGFYLRPLRAIINEAIEDNSFPREDYPFRKKKYQIPASRNIKKALKKQDLEKLMKYKPKPYSPSDRAKDFWIFSYLCNGINFKDISYLKWKDIQGDKLVVVRNKTKRTKKNNLQPIYIPLLDEAITIINKWGNMDKNQSSYVFNILKNDMTPEKIESQIHQFIKSTNIQNKKTAIKLNIEADMTTYYARHTFSTMMKRLGASTELIREQLGQSSTKVTENYLDSFEDEFKREFAKKLVEF